MRAAVVRFPGSNCEIDTLRAVERAGCDAHIVWHREPDLGQADIVLLPGGFSYGDYLRSGAIARFSPIMKAVQRHAAAGGPVLGICNGFQILCEAGLLPGALLPNAGLTFVSRPVAVRVEHIGTPFTNAYHQDEVIRLPVAHGEGRYVADPETVAALEAEKRVVLRYLEGENPNGSTADIAGVCSAEGHVVGIMPHPERVADPITGSEVGSGFFSSMARWTVATG
ncbi:MAG: phosphoribosylformylglycinamidine synthase subunit PurQ [Gemmatimonadales bacterium]